MSEPVPWHRLFGLSLVDFFRGLPVTVDMEKDLSLKQQLLDVVIVRKEAGPLRHSVWPNCSPSGTTCCWRRSVHSRSPGRLGS